VFTLTFITGLIYSRKTQIALAFVYWVRQEYRKVSIFWVHASNAERFRQAFFNIAEKCKIPGRKDPKTDVLPLVKAWLEREDQGPWLMIIDNADDTEMFFGSGTTATNGRNSQKVPAFEGNLDNFIPICSHGAVLVTTRNKQTGIKLTRGRSLINVGPMNQEESDQLIGKRLEGDNTDAMQTSILSSRLEHLPLALVQAAAFIQENSLTVRKYVQLLDQGDNTLVELLSQPFQEEVIDSSIPIAVTSTWIVSFTQIHKQYPCAIELLSLLSFFDRQSVPKLFLASYWQDEHSQRHQQKQTDLSTGAVELEKSLGVLKAFSFVSESEVEESLNMHRLTQLVMRKWLITKGEAGMWGSIALSILSNLFPTGQYENWTTCRSFLPHVYAILSYQNFSSTDDTRAKAILFHTVAQFMLYRGQWNKAEELQAQAVEIRKTILGAEHPDTLSSMANLASSFRNQGRWEKAEELFIQVIGTHKRVLGAEHPGTLMCMANLAATYMNQGRWKEAEQLEMQVMESRKRVSGAEHPDTLTSVVDLAVVYGHQGRWREAEELFMEVIEINKRVLGVEHPITLTSIANLASTYTKQGRYKEAERLEVQVLEIKKRVLGAEHPYTLNNMSNLAITLKGQGRDKEAISLMKECVRLRERVFGLDHPWICSSRSFLNLWERQSL